MPHLARLGDDALVYHPLGSRFESIAAETLGNAGTGGDGFDDMHAAVVSQFARDGETASTLDPHIAAAEFADGEFGATNHSPLVAEIADFQATGDSLTGETTTAVTPTPPDPPAPPAPVSGSGGGGGGDTGVGGGGGGPVGGTGELVSFVTTNPDGFPEVVTVEWPSGDPPPNQIYRGGHQG